MREISTEKIKIGEHVLIDGVEYVAEKPDLEDVCKGCAFENASEPCSSFIECNGIVFGKVEKEPKYRPYKDTDEMIADLKEHGRNWFALSMPLIWVKDKPNFLTTVGTHLIVEIFEHVVRLSNSLITVQNLFDNYTYLDGSPCGKLESK